MSKLKAPPPIRGVYAALATPRRQGSPGVDTAAFFDYQDAVVRAGVDGLVLFGSTGEFVHFDISERTHAVSLLIKRSRVPVLVNVSHSSLDGALALADSALDAGAAGLLVMPPYFYRYTDAQLLKFFEEFAAFADGRTSLFLYNIPFFTNPLSFPLIESLLASGVFAGIKDSSGDPDLLRQLGTLHTATPFIWFAGNESLYIEARSSGAEGIISGVAAALPELIVAMDRMMVAKGFDHMARLNSFLTEFLVWLNKFPATIAIKQAAVVRDWKLDHSAFPFDESSNKEIRDFRRWLEGWLPRMLAECSQAMAAKA